ncbi:MAG: 16S rRNA (guanine(527)-N(7))-methyltransferase RsmG [Fibromonadaceae bacterium]|jgi:16S rRNA (guanine527-N7)-methyltransferase|nr:16S rRNA (guanine(527)-N(7))-methyltransferase RsmG [Fibromonadaceae bacterium]
MKNINLFLSFVAEHGLELPSDFLDKISEFCEVLLEANKTTNLVSKNDEQKLLTRHVADSLIFAAYLSSKSFPTPPSAPRLGGEYWADIGSGAGFPVIPLCLYFPQTKFFAIESRKKRCEFLNLVKQKLNLQNIEIISGKAENSNLKNVDIVSCRAVGSLDTDFELAKTLLKKGGSFLTLKTKRIIEELKAKNNRLLSRAAIWNYKLPQEQMEYALVAISSLSSHGKSTSCT